MCLHTHPTLFVLHVLELRVVARSRNLSTRCTHVKEGIISTYPQIQKSHRLQRKSKLPLPQVIQNLQNPLPRHPHRPNPRHQGMIIQKHPQLPRLILQTLGHRYHNANQSPHCRLQVTMEVRVVAYVSPLMYLVTCRQKSWFLRVTDAQQCCAIHMEVVLHRGILLCSTGVQWECPRTVSFWDGTVAWKKWCLWTARGCKGSSGLAQNLLTLRSPHFQPSMARKAKRLFYNFCCVLACELSLCSARHNKSFMKTGNTTVVLARSLLDYRVRESLGCR